MKYGRSRLQKTEEKKSFRQAIFFLLLTFILIILIFILGIPLIIKVTVYLGNFNSPTQYSQNDDNMPLLQPQLAPLPIATNSAELRANGNAAAGTKIKLYLNNKLVQQTTADKQGKFTIRTFKLEKGDNKLKAVSVKDDKESEGYLSNVLYDTEPPELEITTPKDSDNFFDNEKQIIVSGIAEPQATVLINDHFAIVDSGGSFSLRIMLQEGTNPIKIVAVDEAGNKKDMQLTVNYTP